MAKRINPNLQPSPALAYILGALKGDGYLSERDIQFFISSKTFAESLRRALIQIGLHSKIYIRNRWKSEFIKKLLNKLGWNFHINGPYINNTGTKYYRMTNAKRQEVIQFYAKVNPCIKAPKEVMKA